MRRIGFTESGFGDSGFRVSGLEVSGLEDSGLEDSGFEDRQSEALAGPSFGQVRFDCTRTGSSRSRKVTTGIIGKSTTI